MPRATTDEKPKYKLPFGMGTIFWIEAEQLWAADLSLGTDPVTKKRRRRRIRGKTPQEVEEQLVALKHDKARGLPVHAERQTVAEYLDWWLVNAVDVRESTWTRYEQFVRLQLTPRIGHVKLGKLTPQHVRSLLTDLAERGRVSRRRKDGTLVDPEPSLSPRSIQQCHAVLRAALNEAVRMELISRNPAELVKAPRVPKRRVKPFTVAQAKDLLAAVRGDRLEGLIRVALSLGLREGEALGLRWSDVDLEAGTLTITHQLQRRERAAADTRASGRTSLQFVTPKSDTSQRTIRLPAQIISALQEHRRRLLETRLAAGTRWEEHDLVFPSTIGTPLENSSLHRRFQKHLADAGLPRKRFHDLRHTAASLLLAQGVPLKVVSELLGHSQIGLTADTYTTVLEEVQRDLAERMDLLLTALDEERA